MLLDRPTVLLEEAEPVEVVALQPDCAPSRVWWRGEMLEVREGSGPERINTPWWEAKGVWSTVRDYYKVKTNVGWLWVFREWRGGGWYVQGIW